jgi:protein ImuA
MSGHLTVHKGRESVPELRGRLGLFSFQPDAWAARSAAGGDALSELGVRPGGVVEWLVESEGSGAVAAALHLMSRSNRGRGVSAFVDPAREFYVPAFSGWGIRPSDALVIQPTTLHETCWAIEQCLRCPGVSATWAWVDERIPPRVHRRWLLAAEAGGGVGMFFRTDLAKRQPAWADLRLRVRPRTGGEGDSRQVNIDVLYRRGGLGGGAQVWEIDHAAGLVRLVPELADPTTASRAARA